MPNKDDRDDDEVIRGDEEDKNPISSSFSLLFSIFLTSLRSIFIQNPKLFLKIYILTSLPLSLLLSALSLSSRTLRKKIFHLDWLSRAVDLFVESANIYDESRLELRSLLCLKALYALPIFLFSLLSLTATVSAVRYRRPEFFSFPTTGRAAITSVVNAAAWVAWGAFRASAEAFVGTPVVLVVIMTSAELVVMTVLSLALVVSVTEEVAGVTAVKVAWGLMRGRRVVVGWALSGLVLVGSSCVGREMEGVMDGGDWGNGWTVWIRSYGYMGGFVMLLGWVILWSYVIFTVFYCECRKRVANYASVRESTQVIEL